MYSLVFTINCVGAFLFLFLGWASLKNTHTINIPKILNYVDFSFGLTKFLKFKIQSLCFQVVLHIIFVVMYVCLYYLLKKLPCLFPLPTYMGKKKPSQLFVKYLFKVFTSFTYLSFEILPFIVRLKI
jgi:hypothetical protein